MSMSKTDFFPSLPLRDIVVFPGMIVPLFVGRDKSIKSPVLPCHIEGRFQVQDYQEV